MSNAIYQPANLAKPLHSQAFGNRSVFVDKCPVSANVVTTDKLHPCRVPAGTLVDRVTVKAPDLDGGTTLQAKIGFAPVDGSAAPSGADTAIAAAGAWAQSAATTSYEIFPPYLVEKDSYLEIVPTANATSLPAAADVHAKVEGESMGAK